MGSIGNKLGAELPAKYTPVAHHSLVTNDFDALKFGAAASLQLRLGVKYEDAVISDSFLITSPYNEPGHLLDLRRLDISDQLLAKALTVLQPIQPDYATRDYTESFNWQFVMDLLKGFSAAEGYEWKERDFYVVTFRSQLQPTADGERLHELDWHSHREATESGGLLKYWFGTKNEQFRNLANCIWRSREDARLGGLGQWHKKARAAARDLYVSIEFTTLKLTIGDGVESWSIVDWKEGDEEG
ncbi:hypothetical protein AJ80_03412 [Polytolypa hystricis UAMH7299]|uniref:Uncharacterized protein n=1 Tax=Polytolypa hystricis (strain UAMH7299) TaxID=1447883 RepID=A0A2B7YHL9_POLH7|nr:hypothetical protein AJ80_03412 [Polytolypa hystricis UAMH7299]